MKTIFMTIVLAVGLALNASAQNYDVIVAGAGTGGFGTALQAARMGCKVLLTEETDWLGGQMLAAGVATMDEGTVAIRRHGIYQEFYNRAKAYYQQKGKTVGTCYWNSESCAVEPAVGQKLLYEMIDEVNKKGRGHIDVALNTRLSKVMQQGDRVTGVKLQKGLPGAQTSENLTCKVLVDATEYGDIIPLTTANYRLAKYVNGNVDPAGKVQDFTWTAIVKEYPDGVPDELKIKTAPEGYDKYLRHLSYIKRHVVNDYNVYSNPTSWITVAYYRGLPNSSTDGIDEYTTKTELNIAQNDVSTTVADLQDADLRWKKGVEMRRKTLCLIYYMQNVLGLNWSVDVSQKYDTAYNKWITAKMVTDFADLKPYQKVLENFPVMPYVRESRRIIGLHTLISSDIDRTKTPVLFKDAISINDYPEDLHGSKSPIDLDVDIDPYATTAAELKDWNSRTGPFQLPFGSFIPEKLDGFLVAEKNLSQSRLVNGATRLQPSTMLNGQATGNIAALAVKYGVQPRNVPFVLVQLEQLNAGAPLYRTFLTDLVPGTENWKAAQLCLVQGFFQIEAARFYPENPVSKDELQKIARDNNLDDLKIPDGIITKAMAAKLIKDYLQANAIARLKH